MCSGEDRFRSSNRDDSEMLVRDGSYRRQAAKRKGQVCRGGSKTKVLDRAGKYLR